MQIGTGKSVMGLRRNVALEIFAPELPARDAILPPALPPVRDQNQITHIPVETAPFKEVRGRLDMHAPFGIRQVLASRTVRNPQELHGAGLDAAVHSSLVERHSCGLGFDFTLAVFAEQSMRCLARRRTIGKKALDRSKEQIRGNLLGGVHGASISAQGVSPA